MYEELAFLAIYVFLYSIIAGRIERGAGGMMRPLTPWQKLVAYGALVMVGLWTLFGLFAISLYLIDP